MIVLVRDTITAVIGLGGMKVKQIQYIGTKAHKGK